MIFFSSVKFSLYHFCLYSATIVNIMTNTQHNLFLFQNMSLRYLLHSCSYNEQSNLISMSAYLEGENLLASNLTVISVLELHWTVTKTWTVYRGEKKKRKEKKAIEHISVNVSNSLISELERERWRNLKKPPTWQIVINMQL